MRRLVRPGLAALHQRSPRRASEFYEVALGASRVPEFDHRQQLREDHDADLRPDEDGPWVRSLPDQIVGEKSG
jgi:hypothetical protein